MEDNQFNILCLKKKCLPDWYFDKTVNPESLEVYNFKTLQKKCKEEIDPKDIVGTTHVNYANKPWLQMLSSLQRNKNDCDVEKIKHEILTNIPSVLKLEGKCYITEGNHRLCQAKFLEIPSVICIVQEYIVKEHDYKLYKQLKFEGFEFKYKDGFGFYDISICKVPFFCTDGFKTEDVEYLLKLYKSIKMKKIQKDMFVVMYNIRKSLSINMQNYEFLNFRLHVDSKTKLKYILALNVLSV